MTTAALPRTRAGGLRRLAERSPTGMVVFGVVLFSTGPVMVAGASTSGPIFSFWRLWIGVVVLAIYWIAMALPNRYSSYATILVEPQSIDDQLVRAGVREGDLVERLGIMTARILSRQRLSKMIDKFKLYPDESQRLQRQEVIDLMRSDVAVEPVFSELKVARLGQRDEQFNTFRIFYHSQDPQIAVLDNSGGGPGVVAAIVMGGVFFGSATALPLTVIVLSIVAVRRRDAQSVRKP